MLFLFLADENIAVNRGIENDLQASADENVVASCEVEDEHQASENIQEMENAQQQEQTGDVEAHLDLQQIYGPLGLTDEEIYQEMNFGNGNNLDDIELLYRRGLAYAKFNLTASEGKKNIEGALIILQKDKF
uniref:Uncharacterized protein n=1 Tax=Panagrolaimus sp. PS1159 TaxID=55785 RepID=A0AC35EXF0_9BILA